MTELLKTLLLFTALACAAIVHAAPPVAAAAKAQYQVRVLQQEPMRLGIRATLPIDGAALEMTQSWPGDVPQLGSGGWPVLVRKLEVRDARGALLETRADGPQGWTLAQAHAGTVSISYEVDYALLSDHRWPAMREAAYAQPGTFAAIGRSMFITSPQAAGAELAFELPAGWQASTPWRSKATGGFVVDKTTDLVENLMVLGNQPTEQVEASGFEVAVVGLGHWSAVREDIATSVRAMLARFVEMTQFNGREHYLVVLLPALERGGESFRNSSAITTDAAPLLANRKAWGNTIGHEIFHHWNGWRWRGTDYAATQWFQEGFTEYVTNASMFASGLVTERDFLDKLGIHVDQYRKLQTPLDAPGTRKGPPLYSGGALTAFSWDVAIREASAGRRNLGDMLRQLDVGIGHGSRTYAWDDLLAALQATAPGEWEAWHPRYIHGTEPLPLERAFAGAGLRLGSDATSKAKVEIEPEAPEQAHQLWHTLGGR